MKNILQFRIQKDLIIKRKPIISAFITHAVPIGYKTENKRCPFAFQKSTFHTSKGHLLQCKRASFTMQKSIFELTVMNHLYNNTKFIFI